MRRSSASASRYLGSKEYNCIEPKSFMRRSALPLRVAKCSTTTPDDRGTHLFDLEPLGICANRLLRAFRRHLCLARAILDREFRQRAIDLVHPIVSYRRRSCCRLAPLLLFLVAGLGRRDRRCVGRRRRVERSGDGRVESRSGCCRLLLLLAVRLLGLPKKLVSSNALSATVPPYVLLRAWKPPRRFPTQTLPLLARLPSRAGGADSIRQQFGLQREFVSQRTAPNPALGGGIETCSCSPSEPSRSSAVGSCSIVAVLDRSSSSSSASSRCCRLFRRPIARRGCRKSER